MQRGISGGGSVRVALVNPPADKPFIRDNYCSYSPKANYLWPPIDLLAQSGWLKERARLFVLDSIIRRLAPARALEELAGFRPDIIVSLVGSASSEYDEPFLREAKKRTGAQIFITGDLVITSVEETLSRWEFVDAALLDYTEPDVLKYIEGESPESLKALAFRNGGPRSRKGLPGVFRYPIPAHELFPLKRYRISTSVERRFATVVASVGCNYYCPFCICSLIPLRLRDIDNLMEELAHIRRNMGIREIYFYDPHFTVAPKRLHELLNRIIDEKLDITFFCNAHLSISEESIELLKRAGCHTLMFGIESADPEVLKRYTKGITHERTRRILEFCRRLGIRTFGYFLLGLPHETEASIRATIEFARSLPLNFASFNLPSPVPKTGLYEEVVRGNLLVSPNTLHAADRSQEVSIKLPGLSVEQLLKLKKLAYRRFYLRPAFLLKNVFKLFPPKKWDHLVKDAFLFLKRSFF